MIILAMSYQRTVELNIELKKQKNELIKVNATKDRLFSIIGHDLRGPAGNIPVLLEFSKDESQSPEERKFFLNSAIELAVSIKDTLDKLLYWGKSNMKGIGLNQKPFEPISYINNCIKLISSSAVQKNISIINHAPDDSSKIFADTEHFEFIIRNLLANAVKFTFNDGKVEINAERNKIPGYTVFSIKDNGKGIKSEFLPNIFDALENAQKGTANEVGTNLGLMLCKDFVLENGGKIWVESEEGKGATFFFSLKNA